MENLPSQDVREKQEIICFYHRYNKVAAASFNILTHELKIIESCDNICPEYTLVKSILNNDCYQHILVNANLPNDLFHLMKGFQEDFNNSEGRLLKIPSHLFNYDDLRKDISNTGFFNQTGLSYFYWTSALNISDERLVCAVGGLFYFLKSQHNTREEIKVSRISNVSVNKNLWIDGETYKSLNIFNNFHNPNHHWSVVQDEIEALSIYSMMEKYCSFLGSTKLRQFMASPTMNENVLRMRHELINFCLESNNAATVKLMRGYIDRLSPVSILMSNVKCTAIRGKHWKRIYQNIYYSVLFAEMCAENDEGVKLFTHVKNNITDEMYAMAYHLDRIIDLEKMDTNDVFVVKPGVCNSLEKAKERFQNLMKQLNRVAPYEFDCLPDYIKEVYMIHIPETKFFLGIPYWKKNITKEELLIPGLDYSFSANETAYYKSARCYDVSLDNGMMGSETYEGIKRKMITSCLFPIHHLISSLTLFFLQVYSEMIGSEFSVAITDQPTNDELDEVVGDPQTNLITEECSIIRALSIYIKKHIHFTASLIEIIGELDCIFAMAAIAKEYNYTEPTILNCKQINIKNGIHPLLSRSAIPAMPNSFVSSDRGGLINIVFGPNSSGKTVYLKQIALHAYLFHIGSFIPATEAQFGTLNHICTRVSPVESILANSSSFMNELRRLTTLISDSSPNSLLILDEAGRGTTEIAGVAILAGCLNYFDNLAENSPHVVFSTHLDSIKEYIKTGLFLATHEMDYVLDGENYSFIYALRPGEVRHNSETSLFPLAVPVNIFESANQVLKALRSGKNVTPFTELRKSQSIRILNYLKKFARINPKNSRFIHILKNKIITFL